MCCFVWLINVQLTSHIVHVQDTNNLGFDIIFYFDPESKLALHTLVMLHVTVYHGLNRTNFGFTRTSTAFHATAVWSTGRNSNVTFYHKAVLSFLYEVVCVQEETLLASLPRVCNVVITVQTLSSSCDSDHTLCM